MGDLFSVSGTRVTRGKKLSGFCIMPNAHVQVNLAWPLARTNWASCAYKAREILFHTLLLYVISECVKHCFNRFL
jgi:hypothetical protein